MGKRSRKSPVPLSGPGEKLMMNRCLQCPQSIEAPSRLPCTCWTTQTSWYFRTEKSTCVPRETKGAKRSEPRFRNTRGSLRDARLHSCRGIVFVTRLQRIQLCNVPPIGIQLPVPNAVRSFRQRLLSMLKVRPRPTQPQ